MDDSKTAFQSELFYFKFFKKVVEFTLKLFYTCKISTMSDQSDVGGGGG